MGGGVGAECPSWQLKICQNWERRENLGKRELGKRGKSQKKREKNQEKEEKSGRKGKNWEGSFTLPLLTERAGYATDKNIAHCYFLLIRLKMFFKCKKNCIIHFLNELWWKHTFWGPKIPQWLKFNKIMVFLHTIAITFICFVFVFFFSS